MFAWEGTLRNLRGCIYKLTQSSRLRRSHRRGERGHQLWLAHRRSLPHHRRNPYHTKQPEAPSRGRVRREQIAGQRRRAGARGLAVRAAEPGIAAAPGG